MIVIDSESGKYEKIGVQGKKTLKIYPAKRKRVLDPEPPVLTVLPVTQTVLPITPNRFPQYFLKKRNKYL
ncbi:MAG: hypothetical protein IKP88_08880 [Lachnospiraceae bacterium]|nr:hypothetical protein [Lachnospiraceae bacterium]